MTGVTVAEANKKLINVQGKLTNSTGTPLTGTQTVTFRLYKNAADPLSGAIWTDSQSLALQNGLFNVTLGQNTSLNLIPFDKPYYLGIQIAGDSAEMTPRQLLGASAYALGSLESFHVAGNFTSSGTVTAATVIANRVNSSSVTAATVQAGALTATALVATSMNVQSLSVSGSVSLPPNSVKGTILQTVESVGVHNHSTESTIYTDSSLKATITPRYANSLIKITAVFTGGNSTMWKNTYFTLFHDGVAWIYGPDVAGAQVYSAGPSTVPVTLVKLYSPNTTAPVTLRVRYKVDSGSTGYLGAGATCTLLLEEIGQ